MKLISVVVPCYNEENSVAELYERVKRIFETDLAGYDFELVFADDASGDGTRGIIEDICGRDKRVSAVFNANNFGFHRNVYQTLTYAKGDAAFLMFGDLQDPPELLPIFVREWENGHKCVLGQRTSSEEHSSMRMFRRLYYWVMDLLCSTKYIRMVNGYGLYDRAFLDVLPEIHETQPFLKAVIAEYGTRIAVIPYTQSKGKRKKSNFNFAKNYDFAMHGITSSSKLLMRIATLISLLIAVPSACFALFVTIRKLLFWNTYPFGTAALTVGVFLLGSIQLFFISIVGEYVLSANDRTIRKPRIVAEKTINR